MGTFISTDAAAAGLVYLVLYTFYIIATLYIVRKEGWKSIYTFLLLYGIIRFGGQLSGVVFASLGIKHWQWLIAYLVLGAEGYFVLVLFGLNLIIHAQKEFEGWSWIDPKKIDKNKPVNGWFKKLSLRLPFKHVFHFILIPANVLIIYGGSSTSGKTSEEFIQPGALDLSRALRAAGQSVFLALTIVVIVLAIYVYFKEQVKSLKIITIFLASPFILVRGIFGILSIYIPTMDYYNFKNYDAAGLNTKFILFEYVLGTTMEFITASLYLMSYYYQGYYEKRHPTVINEKIDENVSDKSEEH